MTVAEDYLNALQYGKSAAYDYLYSLPSYQYELAKTQLDFKGRSWIDLRTFLPKFTTEDFEKRRTAYQAKYGSVVNIPGFNDIIHILPKPQITDYEMTAHKWAIQRGLPSPLTPDQLQTLYYKKLRFLRALREASPEWVRTVGAVFTSLDNIEDALVTVSVFGKIAVKLAPRLLGRLVPGLGWVLLGADILNALNLMAWASFAGKGGKRRAEDWAGKNPFHAKSKAARALRLKKTIPTFGEYLEILQTTDQLFGVGLCLGGLMGLVTGTLSKVMTYSATDTYNMMPKMGNAEELTRWGNGAFAADVIKFKATLQQQWTAFKDEAYRLKAEDIQLRNDIYNWSRTTGAIVLKKIKSIPESFMKTFADSMIGSMILNTGKDTFTKEEHTNSLMMLDASIQGIMGWWIENYPIEAFVDIRSFKFRAPGPTSLDTTTTLDETVPDWQATVRWPHLDVEYATIEEITYAYSPMIIDSFKTYCLNYSRDYSAMIAAQSVVDFTKDVVAAYADDQEVLSAWDAYLAVGLDMMNFTYMIPGETEEKIINEFTNWIGEYERKTAEPPSIDEVAKMGSQLGIQWERIPRPMVAEEAEEIFPEWLELQQMFDEIFIPG